MGYTEFFTPLYCSGSGSESDPFIIDNDQPLPRRPHIYGHKSFILIKGLDLKDVYLDDCENITIKHQYINRAIFSNCSNLNIEEIEVNKKLKLNYCTKSELSRSKIRKLELTKSNDNVFKKNVINDLNESMSKLNKYEECAITKLVSNVKEDTFYNRNILKNTEIIEEFFGVKK